MSSLLDQLTIFDDDDPIEADFPADNRH